MNLKDIIKEKMNEIIDEMCFFKSDNGNEFYVKYYFNDHYEFEKSTSDRFIAFLNCYIRQEIPQVTSVNWKPLIRKKCEECLLFDKPVKIYSRLAGNAEEVAYFLADDLRHTVIINKKGWEIMKSQKKYHFKIKENTVAQVLPKRGDDLDSFLRKYVNMNNDYYTLFKINLIQNFFYNSSHYIGIINSSYGCGKTTLTKIWRSLVDPAIAEVSISSKNAEDLKNQLANNIFVMLDNTRQQNNEISDLFCGAVTGTSFSKRKLFTDSDEIILYLKNIIVINGINAIPKNQDMISRSLLFELENIPSSKRMTDEEFWSSFEKDKPYILGCIFDILSKALAIRPNLKPKNLERMADATKDMIAIALAMNISEDKLIGLLKKNRLKLEKTYANENIFVSSIVDYLDYNNLKKLENRVSVIYNQIRSFKAGSTKYFPQSASAFSRKMKEEKHALELQGIEFRKTTKRDATYMIIEQIKSSKKSSNNQSKGVSE